MPVIRLREDDRQIALIASTGISPWLPPSIQHDVMTDVGIIQNA